MGQFSVEKPVLPGSALSGNQQTNALKARACSILEDGGLLHLPGRPFDNSYSLFGAPQPKGGRLVIIGLNGSNADNNCTNSKALDEGFEKPNESNVMRALETGSWGRTPLPKRLKCVSETLGYRLSETIITNSILMCSKDEASLSSQYEAVSNGKRLEHLKRASMIFFSEFTIAVSNPSAVVAYGKQPADILFKTLSVSKKFAMGMHPDRAPYWFVMKHGCNDVPVLCLRHLSRFSADTKVLESFKNVILQNRP